MPTVAGNLLFVSSRAAQVSEVWVRAREVRTHLEGVVTTGNDRFPVDSGQVEFTAVPGPAVLALISQGRAVDTIPILVGDAESQTLRQVVSAAKIADDSTQREIEKLAAQVVALLGSSTENARLAQDGAQRAETAASNAKTSETNASSSASGAESSASSAASSASKAATSEQSAAKSAGAAATSASEAEGSASSAKQDADRAANIADSTSWSGDKLTVNGKTSPSLTGPKGDPGEVTKAQLDAAIATAVASLTPITESASGTGWSVRNTGNVVELRIEGLDTQQSFPSRYAPTAMTYAPVSAQSSTSSYTPRVAINTGGVITPQGFTGKAYGVITYTV